MQQPPEQQQRDVMQDFGGSINIALIIMFSISATVQLYSRLRVGRMFFGWMAFVGFGLQALYTVFNSATSHDAISYQTILGVHLVAFSLHGLQRLRSRMLGMDLHSYDPGHGILAYHLPSLSIWVSSLVSDLLVTGVFAGCFHLLLRCPIQRSWYALAVIPSLLISQLWIQARERFLRQKHVDATVHARHYARTIHRR